MSQREVAPLTQKEFNRKCNETEILRAEFWIQYVRSGSAVRFNLWLALGEGWGGTRLLVLGTDDG